MHFSTFVKLKLMFWSLMVEGHIWEIDLSALRINSKNILTTSKIQ